MHINKTVIITGASSGMGKAIAQALVEAGANVVINARSKEKLEAFIAANQAYADQIRTVVGDISQPSTGKALQQTALEAFGAIDVLINNAGTFVPKPFLEVTEDELDGYYGTTVKGSFMTAQAVIPAMQNQEAAALSISVPCGLRILSK